MIGLIQRVTQSKVIVDRITVGEINQGITLLLGVQKGDTQQAALRLLTRILNYRIFSDDAGKMNRSLIDLKAGLLIIPQFTLSADTQKGNRPSFTPAAPPDLAENLYDYFVEQARLQADEYAIQIQTGRFGADMSVLLVNDGPVTFWLETPPK